MNKRPFKLLLPESTIRTLSREQYYQIMSWLRLCARTVNEHIDWDDIKEQVAFSYRYKKLLSLGIGSGIEVSKGQHDFADNFREDLAGILQKDIDGYEDFHNVITNVSKGEQHEQT